MRATRSCSRSGALPLRTTFTQRSCESAAAPESVSPATTARIVANATAEMKPRKRRAAELLGEQRRGHVAALVDALDRVAPDEHRRAEAEDERDQVEEADEAGRVEHRAARGARVGHGVEAHQDVRQPRGAEHQREAERDAPPTGSETSLPGASTPRPYFAAAVGRGVSGFMPNCQSTSTREQAGAAEEQHGLDDLHPGRRDHPAEQHVGEHHDAARARRRLVRECRTAAGRGCRRRPSARSGRRSRPRACRSPRRCAPAPAQSRYATTSANVYLPRLRSGSAIRNVTTGQPTSQPTE